MPTKKTETKTEEKVEKATKATAAKKTTAKKPAAKKTATKTAKSSKAEALYYGTGRRKNAVARVRLYAGDGKINVNGREVEEYFNRQVLVDDIKSPLNITDTQKHFDIVANIQGGGTTGQAGALRLGISRALLQAGDYRDTLKKAGFLTRDSRMVERKKYGLKKARKKSQFSKR